MRWLNSRSKCVEADLCICWKDLWEWTVLSFLYFSGAPQTWPCLFWVGSFSWVNYQVLTWFFLVKGTITNFCLLIKKHLLFYLFLDIHIFIYCQVSVFLNFEMCAILLTSLGYFVHKGLIWFLTTIFVKLTLEFECQSHAKFSQILSLFPLHLTPCWWVKALMWIMMISLLFLLGNFSCCARSVSMC